MDDYLAGGLEPGPDGAGKSGADDYCRGYVDGLERGLTGVGQLECEAYSDGLSDGSEVAEAIRRRYRRRQRSVVRPGGRR
jgi:hypothetical protein